MSITLKAIVLDRDTASARDLSSQLTLIFNFDVFDTCTSLSELLQQHINQQYDLCLIADHITLPNVSTFLNDFNKIGHPEPCIFAQVRDEIPEGFDRSSLTANGFVTVISRQGDGKDVEALQPLVKTRKRKEVVEEKKKTVKVAMNILLGELDKAAADRRRGKNTRLRSLIASYISGQSEFDPSILTEYLDSLHETTEKKEAPKATSIAIPEKLLKRNLPGLSSNNYSGSSHRVWQKLLNYFGVDPEGKPVAKPRKSKLPPPPPPAPDPIAEGEQLAPVVASDQSGEPLSEEELLAMLAEMENEETQTDQSEEVSDKKEPLSEEEEDDDGPDTLPPG